MLTSSKQTGALPLGSYIFPSSPFRDNLAGSQLGKCQAWSAAPGSSHTAEQRGLGLERRQQLNNSAATLPGMPKQRKPWHGPAGNTHSSDFHLVTLFVRKSLAYLNEVTMTSVMKTRGHRRNQGDGSGGTQRMGNGQCPPLCLSQGFTTSNPLVCSKAQPPVLSPRTMCRKPS